MFSVISNVYNKKTKGPTLMEFFIATGKYLNGIFHSHRKTEKVFFWQPELFDVCTMCDTAHIDTILKFLPHL